MLDEIDGTSLSTKVKMFLTRKLEEKRAVINKLKRKRKITKALYYTSTLSSIIVSTVLAGLSTIIGFPSMVITILSITSAVLTSISIKFNLQDKSSKLNAEIEKLNKLIAKFDFVVSCNGNLTQETYNQIITEFN